MEIILNLQLLGPNEDPSREQKNAFFSDCFEKLQKPIFIIAYDYSENEKDVEDLVFGFFEKMMNWPVSRFRKPENLTGYILKAARNYCNNYSTARKRNQTQIPLDYDLPIPDQGVRIDKTIIDRESITALEHAIRQLPKAQQQVVILVAESFSHQEIAEKLNIRETASTSRLNRARKTLRKMHDRTD